MSRQPKTPKQRAQEALDVEERRVKRLSDKYDSLAEDLEAIDKERTAAIARRDHLKTHPDLKADPATSTTPTPTGAPT